MEVFLEVRTRCGTTAVEEPEIQQVKHFNLHLSL